MDNILIITLIDEGIVISNSQNALANYNPEEKDKILNELIVKLSAPNYVLITPVPIEIRDLRNKRIIT